jgi:tetratricopeptide (TPR) repeat protein
MKNLSTLDNLSFEIAFFERLVAQNPDFVDALIPLAQAYTEAREYKKGLLIDKKLSRLSPFNPTVFYNLACSYALLNMADDAFKALFKAIKLGYKDVTHLLRDPDLESIRTDERFSRLVALLKKEINA